MGIHCEHGAAYGACATVCQNSYLAMPAGWSIAPDTAAIRENVAAVGTWSTHVIVLEGGVGISTPGHAGGSAGSAWGSGYLSTSGSSYKAVILLLHPILGLDRVFDNPWISCSGNICISTVDGKSGGGRELLLQNLSI